MGCRWTSSLTTRGLEQCALTLHYAEEQKALNICICSRERRSVKNLGGASARRSIENFGVPRSTTIAEQSAMLVKKCPTNWRARREPPALGGAFDDAAELAMVAAEHQAD